eukprot:Rmarinus@m.14202
MQFWAVVAIISSAFQVAIAQDACSGDASEINECNFPIPEVCKAVVNLMFHLKAYTNVEPDEYAVCCQPHTFTAECSFECFHMVNYIYNCPSFTAEFQDVDLNTADYSEICISCLGDALENPELLDEELSAKWTERLQQFDGYTLTSM